MEFQLLYHLARGAGRIFSREDLLNLFAEKEWNKFDRCVDVHISSLRKKLGDNSRCPTYLKTVRGLGYMFIKQSDAMALKNMTYSLYSKIALWLVLNLVLLAVLGFRDRLVRAAGQRPCPRPFFQLEHRKLVPPRQREPAIPFRLHMAKAAEAVRSRRGAPLPPAQP